MILWGNDPRPVGVQRADGTTEFVRLRRKRHELPMFMELMEFEHKYYPGSRVPRDFRSRVLVHLGEDVERSVDISMNNPMRLNGWTFFQHKFDASDDTEMSEFAVTRNFGRLVPYWATGITSLGLAMHFLQMQWMELKRRRRKKA
jgi:cytochrome c biogenesis protein ResB